MNEPTGELVGLDFYFWNRDRRESLRAVIDCCCANGGTLSGEILVNQGSDMKQRPFRSIYDGPVRVRRIKNLSDLDNAFSDPDIDIAKVGVWGALGLSRKTPEIITYSVVSDEASSCDSPAIAIVGEGWEFSTPGYERQAKKAGRLCYQRFIDICTRLNPTYAAILNEDSLPCKYDLARGRGNRCFSNFFISNRAYDVKQIAIIENLYQGAYIETIKSGLYVSTWRFYNPEFRDFERERALKLSVEVASIARMVKKDGRG